MYAADDAGVLDETQPLTNEDETLILVMDGWLSNWEELRADLLSKGAKLRTRADAELVLRAYERWGKDCLSRIDGDFAFVIWDQRVREAFCARDRTGNKPFTYHFDGKTLAFASELHAILRLHWVPEVPNEGMIVEIASDELMSREETVWTGIYRLVSSHVMTASAAGLRTACYWRPGAHKPLAYKRDEDYFEHYRVLLFDIIRRHSRCHAPLACEVSGGLNSSAIFGVAEHLRRDSRLSAPSLREFTLAFYDDQKANEVSYARAVGEHLGLEITEVKPELPPFEWYTDLAFHSKNVPGFPNGSVLSLYKLALEGGHRVVLGGLGGDQFLTGNYAYYCEELAKGNFSNLGRCFAQDVRMMGAPQALQRFIRHGLIPLAPLALKNVLRPLFQKSAAPTKRGVYWLSPRMRVILNSRRREFSSQPVSALRRRGEFGLLCSLDHAFDAFAREVGESLNARHRLEYRYPFFSREFIEFAFMTPDRLRSIGHRDKIIHVESLKGILPEKVRTRKTKADFLCTFEMMLKPLGNHLITYMPQARPQWFDRAGMEKLWESYLDQPEAGWQTWSLWGSIVGELAVQDRRIY